MMVAMSCFRCVVVVDMGMDYCVCMPMSVVVVRVRMLVFMFVTADQRVCCCHSCTETGGAATDYQYIGLIYFLEIARILHKRFSSAKIFHYIK